MKFKFDKNASPVHSSEFFYDLFYGGYIMPEEMLEDESDVTKVREAMAIIEEFLEQAQEEELLVEM